MKSGDAENTAVWVGEAVGLIHSVRPAGDIITDMVAEAERLLKDKWRACQGAGFTDIGTGQEFIVTLRSPPKPSGRRAIVVGGSMSGLFTAAFLKSSAGASTSTNARGPNSLAAAPESQDTRIVRGPGKSGAGPDLGVEVLKRIAIDRQGNVTGERPLRQILTSWDRLQRLLRATIDPGHYHLGGISRASIRTTRSPRRLRPRGRSSERTSSSAAMAFARGTCPGRTGCTADLSATTSGGARPTRPIWRQNAKRIYPYFVFYLRRSNKSSAIQSPDSITTCGRPPAVQFHLVSCRSRPTAGHARR